jgi:hypothetical protein
MKLPATNTIMYYFTAEDIFTTANPIKTPINDKKLIKPLHRTVWVSVNELRNNMATSPSYLGISCAIIAMITGMI